MSNLKKKITVKTMGFTSAKEIRKLAESGKGVPVPLVRIVGLVNGLKHGESDYGTFTGLVGMFRATNIHTGEEANGPVCYVPAYITELVMGANPTSENVLEFAVDICVQENETVAVGYEYVGVMHTSGDDSALEALENRLPELPKVKALPAPKKGAKAA